MSIALREAPSPYAGTSPLAWRERALGLRHSPRAGVAAAAAAAALVWLTYLTKPLSSDEGGFLLVASQWSPGTSLYGDYWVDRPPLLIGIFRLADLGGGAVVLRLVGITAVVASVLLAGRLGRLLAPRSSRVPVLAAACAAVFLSTPLFGASEVDGELLAVPFVLAAVVAILQALGSGGRRRTTWWLAAGGLAVAAPLVKQSMGEAFVLAAVVLGWVLLRRGLREAATSLLAVATGATVVLAVVLGWAASRGTTPAGLWDAVVVFRAQAASVISSQANSATPHRATGLLASFLASGAVVLIGAAFGPGLRRTARGPGPLPDVRLLAAALLTWEVVGVAAGGSYWLHYLIGTVPGLVLATVAAAVHHPGRIRLLRATLAYGAVIGLASVVGVAVHEHGVPDDAAVAGYLTDHAAPGDTAVVAFGDPAILEEAHLSSPYPQLWSLPVRVRDPELTQLTQVLSGPLRPTWVVVSGDSLATWGVDASRAQPVLDRDYRPVEVQGDLHVYRLTASSSAPADSSSTVHATERATDSVAHSSTG